MSVKPRCNNFDCFQNRTGKYCELLTANPTQPCPFYQTDEQVRKGREEAHQKLVDEGRFDLIQKYEYNPQRRGQW